VNNISTTYIDPTEKQIRDVQLLHIFNSTGHPPL